MVNEQFLAARQRRQSPTDGRVALSRKELAELVRDWIRRNQDSDTPIDETHIGRIERGDVRWPRADYRAALRAVLGVGSDAELGFLRRRQQPRDPNAGRPLPVVELHEPAGSDPSADTMEVVGDLWAQALDRRTLLAGAGVATTMTLLAGLPPRLAKSVDLDEVLEVQAAVLAGYRRLEGLLGPRAVFGQAAGSYRLLSGLLQHVQDTKQWQRVGLLASDTGILLAWLHFDLDDYGQTSGLYKELFELAERLGDIDLRAFIAGRQSRTLSEFGQHLEALTFADLAAQIAGSTATPAVRSWLAVTRAYVHASLGQDGDARVALDAAAALLDKADEPPPAYLAFYGPPYLQKWAGHTLIRLADSEAFAPHEARAAIDRAHEMWPGDQVRESGEVLAACASARLTDGEIDEAALLTGNAFDVASATGSLRVLRYVTDLRRRLSPHRDNRAVRELDEHLLVRAGQ